MKYTTYILLSKLKNKTYVGHTKDIANRLREHNNGESSFTKKFKPWSLIHQELFDTEKEAIMKERYFKTQSGRKWMKLNLFNK